MLLVLMIRIAYKLSLLCFLLLRTKFSYDPTLMYVYFSIKKNLFVNIQQTSFRDIISKLGLQTYI